MNRPLVLVLLIFLSFSVSGQDSVKPITNTDVLSMTKSGLTEQTILLAIQKGQADFDTSPQALIDLKTSGVSDAVLNAMLSASEEHSTTTIAPASLPDAMKLLDRALAAVGDRQKLTSIRSTRYTGKLAQSVSAGTTSSDLERITYYPDHFYIAIRSANGTLNKTVVTPEFSYVTSGKMTSAVPATNIEALRLGMRFDAAYVAGHTGEFTFSYDGSDTVGSEQWDRLKIRDGDGKEVTWDIDTTGRVRRIAAQGGSGNTVTEFSDYRLVDGLNIAFNRHVSGNGHTSDIIISQYEINPPDNPAWFSPPAEQPAAGLRLRVLQEQSVPYVQQVGGGVSTTCNISGSADTSLTATTAGNYTFGNATTTSAIRMNCNSYDTTVRWPHVLNAMLVEASDGNAYIIACDRAWRWSKCVPLRAGETFNAHHTSKGMAVQAFNTKGQESEPTYTILQSKTLR